MLQDHKGYKQKIKNIWLKFDLDILPEKIQNLIFPFFRFPKIEKLDTFIAKLWHELRNRFFNKKQQLVVWKLINQLENLVLIIQYDNDKLRVINEQRYYNTLNSSFNEGQPWKMVLRRYK
jgi:hypothetical protein